MSGPLLTDAEREALLERHYAAMKLINEVDPSERVRLLLAVVCPSRSVVDAQERARQQLERAA